MEAIIKTTNLNYQNTEYNISYFIKKGGEKTILCLHGLSGQSSTFLRIAENPLFQDFTVIGFDFPGHGKSDYPTTTTVEDLCEISKLFADKLGIQDFFLLGHSLGGVVGTLYAYKYPTNLKGYINIEGNFIGEDAGFSGWIAAMEVEEYKKEFETNNLGIQDISKSLVEISHEGNLMEVYNKIGIPKVFIYGENSTIPYIDTMKKNGLNIVKISDSGHHPYRENPDAFNEALLGFIENN